MNLRYLVMCAYLFLLAAPVCLAQQWVLPPDSVAYAGRPIVLQANWNAPTPDSLKLPSALLPFTLLRCELVRQPAAQGQLYHVQRWLLVATDTGMLRLPALATGAGQMPALKLYARPMPADSLKGYADVKSRLAPNEQAQWPYTLLFLLATLISGWLLWRTMRRYQARQQQRQWAKLSQPEAWKQAMQQLQTKWQQQALAPAEAGAQLITLLRGLVHYAGVAQAQLTPLEAVTAMGPLTPQLPTSSQNHLLQAVHLAYAMQYGRYQPDTGSFAKTLEQTTEAAQALFHTPITT